MRIDKSHMRWLVLSLAIATSAMALYLANHRRLNPAEAGWGGIGVGRGGGGSVLGRILGFAGFGFMLFAGVLGVRKRLRTWPLGRAEFWMRGHLWLGTLTLPTVLFHANFHHGGPLT